MSSGTSAAGFDEEGMRLYGGASGAASLLVPTRCLGLTARSCVVLHHAGYEVLKAEDVANAVLYAVTQPPNVAVNEVLVQPRDEPH